MSQRCLPTHHTINIFTYPEQNPFQATPEIFNLTPYTAAGDLVYDTPAFLAAALDIAQKSGVNLLRWQYLTNPFVVLDVPHDIPVSLDAYTEPPPLPEVVLPDDVCFWSTLTSAAMLSWLRSA